MQNYLESRMLGNLHVRFGVGAGVKTPGLHHFILACEGQSYARLRFNVGPYAEAEIPVGVDYSRSFGATEPDAWEQEYLANMHAAQPVRSMAAELEPAFASPFDEEPTNSWYESWFDYAAAEEDAEELIL